MGRMSLHANVIPGGRSWGFFVDGRLWAVTLIGLVALLSQSLAAFLGRLAAPPTDMVELAGAQLRGVIFAAVGGAGIAALLVSRHRRRAGEDYWVTSALPPIQRTSLQVAALTSPTLSAWIAYWLLSSVALGNGSDFFQSIPILLTSSIIICATSSYGVFIATVTPTLVATPAAVLSLYLMIMILGGIGDESWWGWLLPAGDDALSGAPRLLWLAGQSLWFTGVALLLTLLAAAAGSRPMRLPSSVRLGAVVATMAAGALMLYVNGPAASTGPPQLG